VLEIRDILVRMQMRIFKSVLLTNVSRCGSGMPKKYGFSGSGSECRSRTLVKSHKEEIKVFLTIFCLWWKDPELDPEPDPCSNRSRCGSGTPKNMQIQQIRKWILRIRIEMRTLRIRIEMRTLRIQIWMRIWIPITACRYVITILNHYFLTKFWPNNSNRFQIWHGQYNRSDIVCTFLSWLWICS
jgi:hypothetical protein